MTPLLFLLTVLFATAFGRSVEPDSQPGSRIINGLPASRGQFPWQASLTIQKSDRTILCGGALIKPRWVLTAGHCVFDATSITVALGAVSLTESDPNRLLVVTTSFILHPEYDALTRENDVAVINLGAPVVESDTIRSLIIDWYFMQPDTTVLIAGWGITADNATGASDSLNYVTLETISNVDCSAFYADIIPTKQLCALGNGEGICAGDNGSPLIFYNSAEQPRHAGIATFVSSQGCEQAIPSGFTRTSYYYTWIHSMTD